MRVDWVIVALNLACSRLRDSGGKSFSNKKCEKSAGAPKRAWQDINTSQNCSCSSTRKQNWYILSSLLLFFFHPLYFISHSIKTGFIIAPFRSENASAECGYNEVDKGRVIVVPGSIGYSLDLAHHTAPIVVKGFSMLVIVLWWIEVPNLIDYLSLIRYIVCIAFFARASSELYLPPFLLCWLCWFWRLCWFLCWFSENCRHQFRFSVRWCHKW